MASGRAAKLASIAERVTYWTVTAPALALPAAAGYRIACWRGDWLFRRAAAKRADLSRNVRLVLGNELSPLTLRGHSPSRAAFCQAVNGSCRRGRRPTGGDAAG
jgi:hypothetical protein